MSIHWGGRGAGHVNRLPLGLGRFSPATLFATGEQGAWYDPSDLTTLFQDSAGTTPVTAAAQQVGLALDKSQGLVLGTELSDGTINNVANWIVFGSNTIAQDGDGVAITFVNNAAGAYQQFRATAGLSTNLTVGKWYRVTGQAKVNSGSANVAISTASTWTSAAITSTSFVDFTIYFLCDNATTNYIAAANMSAGEVLTIRALSVKELAGNHAFQSTSAQRPTLGREPYTGVRNLLLFTEQFDNAYWTKSNITITANSAVAPDGTTTADTLTATGANGYVLRDVAFSVGAAGINSLWMRRSSGVGSVTFYDIENNAAAVSLTSEWQRVTSASATTIDNSARFRVQIATSGDAVEIWGAQLETGSTATAYQRVVSSFDVTQAGVPDVWYLSFDGTDDGMLTGTITPGIDKMQIFSGVRKLSDAAATVVAELSIASSTNNGSFGLFAPDTTASATYRFRTRGTTTSDATSAATFAAPITNVITGIGDIAADTAILRANGAVASTSAVDQGTGNYLAYPLYIGRRAGATLPLNGRIYSFILRFGANLSAAQIAQTETWVGGKTGVTI